MVAQRPATPWTSEVAVKTILSLHGDQRGGSNKILHLAGRVTVFSLALALGQNNSRDFL